MRVMITGSSGFVGKATAERLRGKHEVLEFDLMNGCDIRDHSRVDHFVKETGPNRILHLAAIARFSDADADPVTAHEINTVGTANVAAVAEKYKVPLIYGSTGSVYMPLKREVPITEEFPAFGNSVYGCSKYFGELYVNRIKTPWMILRYAHLYGSAKKLHGLIGGFVDKIQAGHKPVLFGGQQSNDFTYITDVVKANMAALEAPPFAWNQVYNIGTGVEVTAEKAGKMVCDALRYTGGIEIKEQRGVDPDRFVYDVSKAERMLGFVADYSLQSGLHDMFHHGEPMVIDLAKEAFG